MSRAGRRVPRAYGWLLRLYPAAFRARFGRAMGETFAEELGAARARGRGAVAGLWLRVLGVTPLLALEERLAGVGRLRPAAAASSLAHETRMALRGLVRAPGFVLVTVVTVGLGVGATASLFGVVNALLLRPLPVAAPGELVRIQELRSRTLSRGMEGPRIPFERYEAYLEPTARVFAGVAAHNFRYLAMRADGPATPVAGVLVSANYFAVLGVRPVTGRAPRSDGAAEAVIGYGLWQRQFGGAPDVVGRTVYLNGLPIMVTGVAPRGFGGTIGFLEADLWVAHGAHGGAAWPSARVATFGRLRGGVTREAAEPLVSAAVQRLAPEDDPTAEVHGVRLEPLTGTPASMAGPVRAFLGILLGTALLVLLIAGANVAGMMLARAVARRREMAVRLALGAGRARLVRQMLIEGLALFAAGGAAGVLVAVAVGRVLAAVRFPVAEPVRIDASPDARVLLFALGVALLTGVLFGLMPALQASRADVAPALRDGDRGASGRGGRARDVFVAAQLAMSVVLLIAATLFVRTLQRSLTLDPGFDADGVLVATTNLGPHGYDEERGRAFQAQLVERVRALPGVESASLAEVALLTGEHESFSGWRATPDGDPVSAGQNVVDDAYFETLRLRLLAGRGIGPGDGAGAPAVVVVNEAFARRFWPGENPIGRVVLRGDRPHEVIGLTRDGAYVQFGTPPEPFAILSHAQRWNARQVLHVRQRPGADTGELIARVRATVAALDPDVAVEQAMPLATAIGGLLFPQRLAAALIGVFGVLGLLLAGVGVYGVLAHDVARRTRELGIRMALGADARRLLRLVLRRGVVLTGAGTVTGLLAALTLTRFLRAFLHGTSPVDAPAFLGVPLVLGAVALLAGTLPARRALAVDPVESLRKE